VVKQPNKKRRSPRPGAAAKEAAKIAELVITEAARIAQQADQDARRSGGLAQFEADLIIDEVAEEQVEVIERQPDQADDDSTGPTARRTAEQVNKLPDQLAKNVDLDVKALTARQKKSKKKK